MRYTLAGVFASDTPVGPSYNVIGIGDYVALFDGTYYDFSESSGDIVAKGNLAPDADLDLGVSTGSLTYSQSLTNYPGVGGVTLAASTKLINGTILNQATYADLVTFGDQTIGVCADFQTPNSGDNTMVMIGGDIGSNASSSNTTNRFSLRDDYQFRVNWEYGSGTDDNTNFNAIPPDAAITGEDFVFSRRDTTAGTNEVLHDGGGTVASLGGPTAYTSAPDSTTGGRITFSGRYGDTNGRLATNTKGGFMFAAPQAIADTYLTTIITKAREGASSGSIYFEADLS